MSAFQLNDHIFALRHLGAAHFREIAGFPVTVGNIFDLEERRIVSRDWVERLTLNERFACTSVHKIPVYNVDQGLFDYFAAWQRCLSEKIIPPNTRYTEGIENNTPSRGLLPRAIDKFLSFTACPAVFPGTLNEEINVGTLFKATSAVIVRQYDAHAKAHWARLSGIPEELLAQFPDDGMHELFSDLHEARHLTHLKPNDSAPVRESLILRYYAELDCDLFAHTLFRQAGKGEETCRGRIHVRYLGLLHQPQEYWFAPVIEAVENRQTPPNFYEVGAAVKNIRGQLGLPEAFEESLNMPEILPRLRQLVEDDKFADLSLQIASRILEAGEYFSKGISYQPLLQKDLIAERTLPIIPQM